MVIYFSFGFYHIGKFITVDEDLWTRDRIPRYWRGIERHDWKATYINDKPGVTLALVSGLGLLKYEKPARYLDANHPSITNETASTEKLLAAFRLPLLIFNGIFSLFLFWIIRKITENTWIALWSSMLILFSPILLGMSQIVNPDALLWTFTIATILSFAAFLKTMEKKFVFFTSLFLGLSLLSKYAAVILFPFIFVMEIFYLIGTFKKQPDCEKDIPRKIRHLAMAYFSIVLGALLIFAVLLPASFIEFKYFYRGTIGYPSMEIIIWPILALQLLAILDSYFWKNRVVAALILFIQKFWDKFSRLVYFLLLLAFACVLINYVFGHDFLNLESVSFDARKTDIFNDKPAFQKILLELRPVAFSTTPLVLISLFYLWIRSLFRIKRDDFLAVIISFFIIIFIAAVIQQELLNIVRYSIITYPLLAILAAMGINSFSSDWPKISRSLITVTIAAISVYSLWNIKPFYLNYTNALLPQRYIISDAWGYGGYEAAQYLNSLPNAKELAVWSDRSGVCEFFFGKCAKSSCVLPSGSEKFDYYVMTRRGKMSYVKGAADYYEFKKKKDYMQCKEIPEIFDDLVEKYNYQNDPVAEWLIGGRSENYVKIFKAGA